MMSFKKHLNILFVVYLIFIFALLLSISWAEYQRYHHYYQQEVKHSTKQMAQQIRTLLTEISRSATVFAEENADQLFKVSAINDTDDENYLILEAKLKRHFPQFFTFTVFSEQGELLIDDFDGFVGEACQKDAIQFAHHFKQDHQQKFLSRIHPNSIAYHFDIMVYFHNKEGKKGFFFISYHPQIIANILQNNPLRGGIFYILNQDQKTLIEITPKGSRDKLKRDFHLSKQEIRHKISEQKIPNSHWNITFISSDVFQRYILKGIIYSILMYGVIFLFIGILVYRLILLNHIKQQHSGEALVKALNKAQMAVKAKSRFLATMSHEIRTPMNGVLGTAELLMLTPLSKQQSQYVKIIYNSGYSLLLILNDILDFSKIEAGEMRMSHIDFDLHVLIEDVCQLFIQNAVTKGIDLIIDDQSNLDYQLKGDPDRLKQILSNLVNNAIKFTQNGHVIISIQIKQADSLIRFEIIDTGIGIAKHKQPLLFKPFSQADESTTRNYGGTGLGLSIVRELILMMKGEVGIISAEGKGATFWFEIPLQKSDKEIAPLQAHYKTENLYKAKNQQYHVLLVEDNQINQVVATAMLHSMGYQSTMVNNGQEALELLEQETFDLILMDIQMPILDGLATTKIIREKEKKHQEKRQIILAMTAHALKESKQESLAMGMDGHINKPIEIAKLKSLLEKWLL